MAASDIVNPNVHHYLVDEWRGGVQQEFIQENQDGGSREAAGGRVEKADFFNDGVTNYQGGQREEGTLRGRSGVR